MSETTQLSQVPLQRLKAFVDHAEGFPWDDPERADPVICNLCAGLDREQELLLIGMKEGVHAALRRAFERGMEETPTGNIRLVYRHLAKRVFIDKAEAQWIVETIAAAAGYIPMPQALQPSPPPNAPKPPPGFSYRAGQPGPATPEPTPQSDHRPDDFVLPGPRLSYAEWRAKRSVGMEVPLPEDTRPAEQQSTASAPQQAPDPQARRPAFTILDILNKPQRKRRR
jgi:hypothetical protein